MSKLDIVNLGLLEIGHDTLASLTGTGALVTKVNSILEGLILEVMSDDWYFNRKRVSLSGLTKVYKLTVDTAPSPANFVIGETITGASSGATCDVIEVLSDTEYLVTEPSDDFTDSETLSDGTNSVDCAADYPVSEDAINMGQYSYGYLFPDECIYPRTITDLNYDEAIYPYKPEGRMILTNADEGYFNYNKFLGASGTSDLDLVPIRARSWFYRLISMKLALVMSPNVTQNLKIKPKAEQDYNRAYLEAKEKNGNEENEKDYSGYNWSDKVWGNINSL